MRILIELPESYCKIQIPEKTQKNVFFMQEKIEKSEGSLSPTFSPLAPKCRKKAF